MICGLQEEIILSIKTMNAIEKILATLQVLKSTIQPRRICNRGKSVQVKFLVLGLSASSFQAELDANRDVMETMCKRAEVLCTRLDIDKSQYLNPNMVGNSKRHIQEVT